MGEQLVRRAGVLLFAGGLVATSACTGIPTDGKARVVRAVRPNPDDGGVADPAFLIARPPELGAKPAAIVRGFLTAQADPSRDYKVARSFLRPPLEWATGSAVLVYSGTPQVTAPADESAQRADVQVRVHQVGRIDATGRYVPAEDRPVLQYRLVRLSGEWRIDDLPDGLALSSIDVLRSFRRATTYFLDPDTSRLVPDERFLRRSDTPSGSLATAIAQALLAGPSAWLRPAVVSAVPPDTQINGLVDVVGGIADVRLSRAVQSTPPDVRRQLAAQLVWTLTAPDLDIQGVRLSGGGQSLGVSGIPRDTLRRTDFPEADPAAVPKLRGPVFVRSGRVLTEEGETTRRLTSAAGYASPALSPDGKRLALLQRGALLIGPVAGPLRQAMAGSLTAPSWAPGSTGVWLARHDGTDSTITFVAADGRTHHDAGRWPGHVSELRVSPDGRRLAAVVEQHGRRTLQVARVERSGNARRVGGYRAVAPVLSDARSVVWQDASRLLVVGTGGGLRRLWRLESDGWELTALTQEGLPSAPEQVAAAPGQSLLVSIAGALYRRVALGQWSAPFADGHDPAYTG